jgi:hypothetical protein
LKKHAYVDLRDAFSCWLSQELPQGIPGIRFKRLLCFERPDPFPAIPSYPVSAAVRDLFRALAPFVAGDPHIRSVAMPLMALGAGYSAMEVLPLLLETSIEWLKIGMPLQTIRFYGRNAVNLLEAQHLFAQHKATLGASAKALRPRWDAFISYAHADSDAALFLAEKLECQGYNIFVDQLELKQGVAWQQEIFTALDDARINVAIYSPDYVRSKVCLEEFNIAWARNRDCSEGPIFPIYWRDGSLPTYMRSLNYFDCRERDNAKLDKACARLTDRLAQQN